MNDSLLQNGDLRVGPRGLPQSASSETEALIQRAMIRLSVRRGSFPPDEELGSDLHRLESRPGASLDGAALELARQALLPMPEVTAVAARCIRGADHLRLRLELSVQGIHQTLEVNV